MRFASLAALIAALLALAAEVTLVGFNSLAPHEQRIGQIVQGCAFLSLVAMALSYFRHRDASPLIVALLAAGNLAYHFYWELTPPALWAGLAAMVAAAIWNGRRPKLKSG